MSRFASSQGFDYCLRPLHIIDDGKDVVVPCGTCNGCLLHRANSWSMRLGSEIEANPFSIFATFTYSNDFLPTLVYDDFNPEYGTITLTSNHRHNWRFANSRCSLREDNVIIPISCEVVDGIRRFPYGFAPIPVTNWKRDVVVPYSSKRDFQLYLKQLYSYFDDEKVRARFSLGDKEKPFRYFAISEYGETLLRPHVHAIFFPCNKQVADFFVSYGLYAYWQMCDKDRFDEFCGFCNSGTRNYLTQYLTDFSNIPQVLKDKQIAPFRLSSRSPAIGYVSFSRAQICEDVSRGVIEYHKRIDRCEDEYVLRYPKDFVSSFFPKCAEFAQKSFDELLLLYGYAYRLKHSGCFSLPLDGRLFESMCASDEVSTKKCLQVCDELGFTPFHYCYLLDMYWYKSDMYALKLFYQFQQSHISDSLGMCRMYNNFGDYIERLRISSLDDLALLSFHNFCESFGIDFMDLYDGDISDITGSSRPSEVYVNELQDIVKDMVKMPKLNEALGLSPNSNF